LELGKKLNAKSREPTKATCWAKQQTGGEGKTGGERGWLLRVPPRDGNRKGIPRGKKKTSFRRGERAFAPRGKRKRGRGEIKKKGAMLLVTKKGKRVRVMAKATDGRKKKEENCQ